MKGGSYIEMMVVDILKFKDMNLFIEQKEKKGYRFYKLCEICH